MVSLDVAYVGLDPWARAHCVSLFSITEINTRTKSNPGEERVYLAYSS